MGEESTVLFMQDFNCLSVCQEPESSPQEKKLVMPEGAKPVDAVCEGMFLKALFECPEGAGVRTYDVTIMAGGTGKKPDGAEVVGLYRGAGTETAIVFIAPGEPEADAEPVVEFEEEIGTEEELEDAPTERVPL